jgi:hypothetical protein
MIRDLAPALGRTARPTKPRQGRSGLEHHVSRAPVAGTRAIWHILGTIHAALTPAEERRDSRARRIRTAAESP